MRPGNQLDTNHDATLDADGVLRVAAALSGEFHPGEGSITVTLSGADGVLPSPGCSWDFKAAVGGVAEVRVDLGRLDTFAASFSSAEGESLADSFVMEQDFSLQSRMVLEVARSLPRFPRQVIARRLFDVPGKLLESLARRSKSRSAPTIEWFFIELTNGCNFRCRWCPESKMSRPVGRMSLERAKSLLDQISLYRQRRPILSYYSEIRNPIFLHVMGEPLLHPQVFEVVEYGHSLGLSFCLVTNTSQLTPQVVRRLLDAQVEGVVLSLNACDAQSFGATGSSVSYRTCVEQARSLISERLKRGTAFPRIEIQLLNTKRVDIPGVAAVASEEQVEKALWEWSGFVREQERRFSTDPYPLDPQAQNGWRDSLDEKTVTVGRYVPIGHEISLVFKSACNFANALLAPGMAVEPQMAGTCPFRSAHKTLCVFWDGSCSYCTLDYDASVKLGNVFDGDIESIWSGERMSRIRASMERGMLTEPLCRRCQGRVVPTATIFQNSGGSHV